MFKPRNLRGLMLLMAMPGMAQADLPALFGNLQIPSTLPSMVEDSADLIIQLPRQVDQASPVPLRVRVLQSPVAAITLLSDAVDPQQLATFQLEPGVDAQLATRFMSAGVDGVLVVVRTATGRIFAGRRAFQVTSAIMEEAARSAVDADAGDLNAAKVSTEPEARASDTSAKDEAAKDESVAGTADGSVEKESQPSLALRLDAQAVGERTKVTLRSAEPLVKRMQHQTLKVPDNPVQSFELKLNDRPLVRAELDPAMWSDPFFSFSFAGGKAGDSLTLAWIRADGEQGELQASIVSPTPEA